jgi:hypothetical protein
MKRYWCGWEVDDILDQKHFKKAWPKGMWGWCSGYGPNYRTYVGIVTAESEKEATEILLSCFGKMRDKIRLRWDPEEKSMDFEPGDRFPMSEKCRKHLGYDL